MDENRRVAGGNAARGQQIFMAVREISEIDSNSFVSIMNALIYS